MNSTYYIGFILVILITASASAYMMSLITVLNVLLILIGIVVLIKGADYLVSGGSEVAGHYGISQMIIGLTIVAFGTSMPEFMVSVYASIIGSGGISIGNVVGSNIFNILMVIGIPAAIAPIAVKRRASGFDTKFMILAAIVLFIVSFRFMTDFTHHAYIIGAIDGIILLALFAYFMRRTVKQAKTENKENKKKIRKKKDGIRKGIIAVIVGIIGIGIGGQLLVENGRTLAISFGIPEIFIGMTLMAFGTSLPELAAGVIAVLKKKHEMAIGNVIGSNIFNTLLVAGSAALVRPIIGIGHMTMFVEIPFMIIVSIMLWGFMRSGKEISRGEGMLFIAFYGFFMYYLVLFSL